ncbi:MAG: radical SAM protein [Deltaproteobacteria bacterium]|nr:radical SAM protein [Deltaproteobacteria bacterium]
MDTRVLLKTGYRCNNNCVFCHAAPHRGIEARFEQLQAKILEARQLGARCVVLSGGEPTIRPDLMNLADAIQAAGMRIGLVTNGRMLAYSSLVRDLLERGLEYVYCSVCSASPELHDRLVRSRGAFEQTWKGLVQVIGKVPDLTVNLVLTRAVLGRVLDAVERIGYLSRRGPLRLKLSMVEPEGNALCDFEGLVPLIAEAATRIREAVDYASDRWPDLELLVDGLPLCALGELAHLDSGLREDSFFAMSEAFEQGWYPVDELHKSFGKPCPECSLRRRCRGVFRVYLDRRGDGELIPARETVSNSFIFIADSATEAICFDPCPIQAGEQPAQDPVRGLMVAMPGGIQRFTAGTRDFSDQTLARCKAQGQVYLAHSDQGDLVERLQSLELVPACADCSLRRMCSGIWTPREPCGFARAKAMLDLELGALRGLVLDVGCGAAPYLDSLLPAMQRGELSYIGVDPERGTASAPNARWLQTSFEDLCWDSKAFDCVMALRSLNHLPGLRAALEKMLDLLRPGGRLLLADDEVFGVVAEAGREGRASFEHWRSSTHEEIAVLANELGLKSTGGAAAGETSSPMWIASFESYERCA